MIRETVAKRQKADGRRFHGDKVIIFASAATVRVTRAARIVVVNTRAVNNAPLCALVSAKVKEISKRGASVFSENKVTSLVMMSHEEPSGAKRARNKWLVSGLLIEGQVVPFAVRLAALHTAAPHPGGAGRMMSTERGGTEGRVARNTKKKPRSLLF